jgi:SAM-dependent methyltransferase
VLDVAAGNGNVSLAAARIGCDVTASDYVPALLEGAKRRADAEGLPLRIAVADAEDLPFADGSFDAVVSTFGVMFAPNQEAVAQNLLRVCRPGGRIGLASWTPDGFIGELFRVVGAFVPPPSGVSPPALWGTAARISELFGASTRALSVKHREFAFRYRSPEHFVEVFRTFYGPVHKAFGALDGERQRRLEADLLDLLRQSDRGGAAGLVVPAEYLETVIVC